MERITVEQYHRIIDARILREGEPIELLDGALVLKDRSARGASPMSVGTRHSVAVQLLLGLDSLVEARGRHIRVQTPITLPPWDEPEPDGAIVRGIPRDYLDHHPGPGEVFCVIEVADNSLLQDRKAKLRTYASAGLPLYAIVNLVDDVVEVFRDPRPADGSYARTEALRRGDTLSIELGVGAAIQVQATDLLP